MNHRRLALVLPLVFAFHAPGLRGEEGGPAAAAAESPAPFPLYWDAQAWERGSSQAFWRAREARAEAGASPARGERSSSGRRAEAASAAETSRRARPARAETPRRNARGGTLLSHKHTEK